MELTFQFSSLADMLSMGGHGPYVWASYLITLTAIAGLGLAPYLAQRRFLAHQRALKKRQTP